MGLSSYNLVLSQGKVSAWRQVKVSTVFFEKP